MRGQAGNLKNGLDDPKKAFTLNYPNSVVEDIIALLDQIHIEAIPTVGYSLGGSISILLAKSHAKRISSLTLLAPGIHPNEQIMIQHASQLMRKGLLPNIPRGIDPWMRPIIRYYGKKYHIMGEAEYYGIKEGIFSTWGDIFEQAVPHVNQPTQIIQGKKDTIVSVASSRWLHEQWPTSRLHILPEAGHGLHNESTQIMHTINAYIHKFVIPPKKSS